MGNLLRWQVSLIDVSVLICCEVCEPEVSVKRQKTEVTEDLLIFFIIVDMALNPGPLAIKLFGNHSKAGSRELALSEEGP